MIHAMNWIEKGSLGALAGLVLLGCSGAPSEEAEPPELPIPAPSTGEEMLAPVPWGAEPEEPTGLEFAYAFSSALPAPLGLWPATYFIQGGPTSPTTYVYNLGATSGLFTFRYHHGFTPERVRVRYRGITTFDTGCTSTLVSPFTPPTAVIPYSGDSSEVTVEVTPRCDSSTAGTAWNFWLDVPDVPGQVCGGACPAGSRVLSQQCTSSCPGACGPDTPNAVTCGDFSLSLNSGFEFGQSGWSYQTSATSGSSFSVQGSVVRSGGLAASLTHGADGAWGSILTQIFTLSARAGDRYLISAWARGGSGGERGDLHVQSENSWSVHGCTFFRAEATWRRYGCAVRIPAAFDTHRVRGGLRVASVSPNATIHYDDVFIQKLDHDELLNGGFEEGFVGWSPWDTARPWPQLSTTAAHQGTTSLAVTADATGANAAVQTLPPAPVGATVTLRARARAVSGSATASLVLRINATSSAIGSMLATVSDSGWTELVLPVTLTTSANGQELRVDLRNLTAGATVLFDSVSLSRP